MTTLKERKMKALFEWAKDQRADYLASILVHTLSWKTIDGLIKDHNIKVPKP